MKRRIQLFTVLLWALHHLLYSGAVSAAPLNLTTSYPDFTLSAGQAFSFVHDPVNGGGTLTISSTNLIASYTETLSNSALVNMPVSGGTETFLLTATLNSSGNLVSGNFKLDGQVRSKTSPFPVVYNGNLNANGLLSGQLNMSGFNLFVNQSNVVHGIIEFTFNNASGVIATDTPYGTFGAGGMILTLSSSNMPATGAFLTQNWTGSGSGDVFVPVPAAVWLFGSGILALVGVARRKARK